MNNQMLTQIEIPTQNKIQKNKAFTIMEMLVVIAIFGVLTAVVMFQYGKFNSQTIMTNTAYEVATTIQQAQVFSLGHRVLKLDPDAPENLKNRYGVYFDLTRSLKEFIFFIDYAEIDSATGEENFGDGMCTNLAGTASCFSCTSDDECLDKFRLTRDMFFDEICVSNDNDPIDANLENCAGIPVESASVTFNRPNPDAVVFNPETGDEYSSLAVIISNSFGNRIAVIVRNTGQISVERMSDKE